MQEEKTYYLYVMIAGREAEPLKVTKFRRRRIAEKFVNLTRGGAERTPVEH